MQISSLIGSFFDLNNLYRVRNELTLIQAAYSGYFVLTNPNMARSVQIFTVGILCSTISSSPVVYLASKVNALFSLGINITEWQRIGNIAATVFSLPIFFDIVQNRVKNYLNKKKITVTDEYIVWLMLGILNFNPIGIPTLLNMGSKVISSISRNAFTGFFAAI